MFSQLKIAYIPGENFSLRDFHHAVNNLPNEAFLPELDDSGMFCSHGSLFYSLYVCVRVCVIDC